jgi:hypothetical protein
MVMVLSDAEEFKVAMSLAIEHPRDEASLLEQGKRSVNGSPAHPFRSKLLAKLFHMPVPFAIEQLFDHCSSDIGYSHAMLAQ